MGVWDITTPLGSESKSLGDDRIRELKTAIQEALRAQQSSGVVAVFPGANPSSAPTYEYRGRKDTTANRPASGDNGLFIDTDRKVIQRDNGASWEDIATMIPSGTVMVFYQAAAPAGWTQVTTQNDKALRVVSAVGGGSGGTLPISTGVSHSHTVNSHTHDLANHTHSTPSHSHPLDSASVGAGASLGTKVIDSGGFITGLNSSGALATALKSSTTSSGSGTSGTPSTNTSGAATPGTDTQAPVLAYADVIICSKN